VTVQRFHALLPTPRARRTAQIGVTHLIVVEQFRARAAQRDSPRLDHIRAIGRPQRLERVLLDQQNRRAFGVDGTNDLEDVIHQLRRETE